MMILIKQLKRILAGLMKWPQGTFASKLDIDMETKKIKVTREVDNGLETIQLSIPSVISCD